MHACPSSTNFDRKLSVENEALRQEIEGLKQQVSQLKSKPSLTNISVESNVQGKEEIHKQTPSADLLTLIDSRIEQGMSKIGKFPEPKRGFHPGSGRFLNGETRRPGRYTGRGKMEQHSGRYFCGYCHDYGHLERFCGHKLRGKRRV